MSDKLLLGHINNKAVHLKKHEWECDWYWALGRLNTKDMSFHMRSVIPNRSNADNLVFEDYIGTIKLLPKYQGKGWYIMEMFERAEILKTYAELKYLGHAGLAAIGSELKDREEAKRINAEIKEILDEVWNYLNNLEG